MLLKEICIDYHLLSEAIYFYLKKGYCQIEVPWTVSAHASLSTAQVNSRIYISDCGEHFIGSAEQGFIQLMVDKSSDLCVEKKYMSVSPCFRRDSIDETHCQQFIKLELFFQITTSNPVDVMNEMVADAKELFNKIHGGDEIEIVADAKQFTMDLFYKNLELGSYGFRTLPITIGEPQYGGKGNSETVTWVFGTGIALPRTQLMVKDSLLAQQINATTH